MQIPRNGTEWREKLLRYSPLGKGAMYESFTILKEGGIMQKYYLIEWPESKRFMKDKRCIQSHGMSFFVPCELYDAKNKDST